MRTLVSYIEANGISVETLEGPDLTADEDGWEHYAYQLKLYNEDQDTEMETSWRQGIGITDDPEDRPERILDCLISDAWGYENAQGFEDWAAEYGYDTDSRRAEATYRAVEKTTNAFLDFLGGKPELEKLALKYERL